MAGMGDVKTKIVNARIASTMLGIEDHGLTTFWLMLEWGSGSAQGYGGYLLGSRECPACAFGFAVRRVLETVGVASWEKLAGQLVRIDIDDAPGCANRILGIGNIIKDCWFRMDDELKELSKR